MKASPYKKRLQVAVSILSDLTKNWAQLSREDVVRKLEETYKRHGIEPLRGRANPPDIYDKEMATLYVVGKYGLLLHQEYPEIFSRIFFKEEILESAIDSILSGNYEQARQTLKNISPTGVVDSNAIARMLRMPMTKLVLGFSSEDEFVKIIRKTAEAFPEESKTVENYVKFFVAFKTAEAISRGEVRNREYKEAYKKALAIRLGFPKAVPGDRYVADIATEVFGVDENTLSKILKLISEDTGKSQQPGQDSGS